MDRSHPLSVKDKIEALADEGLLKYFWGNGSIICGNVGTVFFGGNAQEKAVAFYDYREQSRNGVGRVAGECVVVFRDNEIVLEYIPEGYNFDD